MSRATRRARMRAARPHAPTVAAVLLVAALTSFASAWAATSINGARLASRSIAGSKLKLGTLGGAEINEAKLGTVPQATAAASAASATDAGKLGGVDKSGYMQGRGFVSFSAPGSVAIGDTTATFSYLPAFTIDVQCKNPISNGALLRINNMTANGYLVFVTAGGTTGAITAATNGSTNLASAPNAGATHVELDFPESIQVTGVLWAGIAADPNHCGFAGQATLSNPQG